MRLVRYRWLLSAAAYFSPLAIPVAVPLHAQAVAGAGVISGTVLATGSETPIANLFLAGAYNDTGWPATMESAVRSGIEAARAVERSAHLNEHRLATAVA